MRYFGTKIMLVTVGSLIAAYALIDCNAQSRTEPDGNKVQIYLSSDKESNRGKPYNLTPVSRIVSSQDKVEEAIHLLIIGPTEEERSQGFSAPYTERMKIKDLRINNKVAHISLISDCKECPRWGGLLAPEIFRDAIESTLKQFSNISKVKICLDGYEDFGNVSDEGPKKKCK